MWKCPVCGAPLVRREQEHRDICPQGHSFDRSRSGYLHLLPVERTHGGVPGDNKLMVEARRRFLDGGHYAPLAQRLAEDILRFAPPGAVLDIGCGEGYYLSQIAQRLPENGVRTLFGVDISKTAVDKAARRCRMAQFAVGSAFRLPVTDGAAAAALNVFAPYCGEEIRRVLRADGVFIMALPGADHLWELKQQVYDRPYKNEVKPFALEGFDLVDNTEMRYPIDLPDGQTIRDLFMMTPYYYKTGRHDQEKLLALDRLTVTAHFFVPVYRPTR